MRQLCVALILATLCALITACQASRAETPIDAITLNDPEDQLVGVAQSVEKSLRTLAEAQDIKIPTALDTAPLTTEEGGLGHRADIDWAGPIGPLVQKIADLGHYHMKTLGPEPELPIIIAVSAKNVALADILKDTGLQAGSRANVVVFPASRVIELRYTRT